MRQVSHAGLIVAALVTASALTAQQPAQTARVRSNGTIYYEPTGKTCNATVLSAEAKKVKIKAPDYRAGMISADSAKVIALCYVPGQITSGEMNSDGTRSVYAVTVIPDKKKTHTKVIVDANTGEVLSVKQFGGVRGFVGWVRESAEHKKNKKG